MSKPRVVITGAAGFIGSHLCETLVAHGRRVRVLDDAYNANVDSMRAALETLRELPCEGRRVAVLGDMAELGAHSEAAHVEVGRCAAESGVGQLFAVHLFSFQFLFAFGVFRFSPFGLSPV